MTFAASAKPPAATNFSPTYEFGMHTSTKFSPAFRIAKRHVRGVTPTRHPSPLRAADSPQPRSAIHRSVACESPTNRPLTKTCGTVCAPVIARRARARCSGGSEMST